MRGPFGPLYDTSSPEWRQAGGNLFVYQEIMQQKAWLQQERMLWKQQQDFLKWQKAQERLRVRSARNAAVRPDQRLAEQVHMDRPRNTGRKPKSKVATPKASKAKGVATRVEKSSNLQANEESPDGSRGPR
ncbi:MAG: hypothetical protein NVSMB9_14850 [Isosphaeraceae bacterium]